MSPDRNWTSDGMGNVTSINLDVRMTEIMDYIKERYFVPSYFEVKRMGLLAGDHLMIEFARPAEGKEVKHG